MGNKNHAGLWKKGKSGNPKGRKPILLPALQQEIDQNRGSFKQLVLLYFGLTEDQITERQRDRSIPFLERMLGQCFERTAVNGDVDAFKKLLEFIFGRMPEEPKDFTVTEDEKVLVLAYRRRMEGRALTGPPQSHEPTREDEDQDE